MKVAITAQPSIPLKRRLRFLKTWEWVAPCGLERRWPGTGKGKHS